MFGIATQKDIRHMCDQVLGAVEAGLDGVYDKIKEQEEKEDSESRDEVILKMAAKISELDERISAMEAAGSIRYLSGSLQRLSEQNDSAGIPPIPPDVAAELLAMQQQQEEGQTAKPSLNQIEPIDLIRLMFSRR